MEKTFARHIEKNFPELLDTPFLLACSGGLDSVVLTHLFAGMQLDFSLAHCNFQLRGEESDSDADFVRNLAKTINKSYFVKGFETEEYVLLHKVSIQEGARKLRYRWFNQVCSENQLEYIVTAHHADDALETFLFHLSRGAGLGGLTGIPERNQNILRPLLPFTKQEIHDFAVQEQISWRYDRSNEDTSYFRNKIRHELLPQFQELHPAFLDNFRKSVSLLKESHAMLQDYVKVVGNQLFEPDGDSFRISVKALKEKENTKAWCYELFSPFGFTDWESIVGLLNAPSGKIIYSPTHELLKDRSHLIVRPVTHSGDTRYDIGIENQEISIPITLKISEVNEMGPVSKNILYIDKETLNGRLHVRKWQKGDYFYPLGMGGKKLVSKFFKDIKLNQFEKSEQWLLCAGDDIIWIIGQRADDRFKIRPSTKKIIKIEYHP